MKPRPIVSIVDDDASVGRSLKRLMKSAGLDSQEFASAQEFLRRDPQDRPGCLVLDVRMPGLSGLDLQKELAVSGLSLPIIFITGHGDIPMSVKAMKSGAVDFLPKPFNEQELLDAIHRAIDRDIREREQRQQVLSIQQRVDLLTRREQEVFALVVTGMLNKQVAGQLGVAEKTVKVHRARVMEKMKADSLAHLVRLAEKVGVSPPEGR